MTATTAGAFGQLDIGRVIQQTFAVLGRNFAPFLILAVVLIGIPTAVFYSVQGSVLQAGVAGTDIGQRLLWSFAGALVMGLAAIILQATIIYGTVSDLNGRRESA